MFCVINYDSFKKLDIKIRSGIQEAKEVYQERLQKIKELSLRGIKDETLVYVETQELLKQLALVEEVYQKVSADKKVKDMVLIDSFHSATIEGARTTVAEVRRAFELPRTKDDKMVVNTVKGMNFALEEKITTQNLGELWKIVVKDVCENEGVQGELYRNGMVRVGSISETVHVPEKPEKIAEKMQDMFTFSNGNSIHPILVSFLLHFYFVYIHPMCDGNGRTARIIMNSYLYHHGVEKITYLPISRSINENLAGYFSSIKECEDNIEVGGNQVLDVTPFLVYMLNVFEDCILNSIASEHELNELENKVMERMRKIGKGAEISVKKCAGMLKVVENEALDVLDSLADKGYVVKRTEDGIDIYRML